MATDLPLISSRLSNSFFSDSDSSFSVSCNCLSTYATKMRNDAATNIVSIQMRRKTTRELSVRSLIMMSSTGSTARLIKPLRMRRLLPMCSSSAKISSFA